MASSPLSPSPNAPPPKASPTRPSLLLCPSANHSLAPLLLPRRNPKPSANPTFPPHLHCQRLPSPGVSSLDHLPTSLPSSVAGPDRLTAVASVLDAAADADSLHAALRLHFSGASAIPSDAAGLLSRMSHPGNAVLVVAWLEESRPLIFGVYHNHTNPIHYNITFKKLRYAGDWGAIESLWDAMLAHGVRPDGRTFSHVISGACRCGLPDKAVEWIDKMPSFGVLPGKATLSAMINAYGNAGDVGMALTLYNRARQENCWLDSAAMRTIIWVHAHSNNFDAALEVFKAMKARNFKPSAFVYNTLLDAMSRARRPWLLKTLHDEMIAGGVTPTQSTYSTLLLAYTKARYADDTLAVYRRMKDLGMKLTTVLCNKVLATCTYKGRLDEAEEVFNDLQAAAPHCQPDIFSYSSLIAGYASRGQVVEAEAVLAGMQTAGLEPDIFVLTSLVRCYGKAGLADRVVDAVDELRCRSIIPDERFCGCLLNVAVQMPAAAELGKMTDCIRQCNAALGSLVGRIAGDDADDLAAIEEEARKILTDAGAEVKKAFCNSLMDLCLKLDRIERAFVLLKLALELEIYSDISCRAPARWFLNLRGLSSGAAITALHFWMDELAAALESGEELPMVLGVNTGHGRWRNSERLSEVVAVRLRELGAPFHKDPSETGRFLTSSAAVKVWLDYDAIKPDTRAAADSASVPEGLIRVEAV